MARKYFSFMKSSDVASREVLVATEVGSEGALQGIVILISVVTK